MTLDATVGGASANSYLDVASADALAGEDLGPEAVGWVAAITGDKEKALKRATREIDGYLRTGWGSYVSTQALLFPRSVDVAGSTPTAFIPTAIKRATYEQAIYVLKNAAVLAGANTRRARNLASASEPSVAWSERSPDDGSTVLSAQALHYLSGFRVASQPTRAGSVRSLRVQPGFRGW